MLKKYEWLFHGKKCGGSNYNKGMTKKQEAVPMIQPWTELHPQLIILCPVIEDPAANEENRENTSSTSLQGPPSNKHLKKIMCSFKTSPQLTLPNPPAFPIRSAPPSLSQKVLELPLTVLQQLQSLSNLSRWGITCFPPSQIWTYTQKCALRKLDGRKLNTQVENAADSKASRPL